MLIGLRSLEHSGIEGPSGMAEVCQEIETIYSLLGEKGAIEESVLYHFPICQKIVFWLS